MNARAAAFGLFASLALLACSRDKSVGARAFVVAEPSNLDFGARLEREATTLTVTIGNEGRASLAISSLKITGDRRGAFTLVDTLSGLDPGAYQQVVVRYTPPIGAGVDSAFLVIESNAENAPTSQIGLQGTTLSSCVPETDAVLCARLGKNCESLVAGDNCGVNRTVITCGDCVAPLSCGATMPNVCGCVVETDAMFCARLGKSCGPVADFDNCGNARSVASCGSCQGVDEVCGLTAPNVCGCGPESDELFCARLARDCGPVTAPDNCGAARAVSSCGTCSAPRTCGAIAPGQCGCVAEADAVFCSRLGKNCGTLTGVDNCGAARTVTSCGTCAPGDTCGGVSPNSCACVNETDAALCARRGQSCGQLTSFDNCGLTRTISSCGTCVGPQTCGAVVANQCGCVGESDAALCARQGQSCGPVTAVDNCGVTRALTSCGACVPPPNATASCNAGTCDFTCSGTLRRCGNACCDVVTSVSAGSARTFALDQSGLGTVWGAPHLGDNGDGGMRTLPTPLVGLSGATQLRAGTSMGCGLGTGGMFCWGENANGQLGDGTTTRRLTPTPVLGLSTGVTAIAPGEWHSCAIVGGGVKCWGNHQFGQVGDGTTVAQRNSPVNVTGLTSGAAFVAVGRRHSCAALGDGGVRCWGMNAQGAVGDGTTSNRNAPVVVSGLPGPAIAVAAGDGFSCALLAVSGQVHCWGANAGGALGDGTTAQRTIAGPVSALAGVVQISAGSAHACAVTGGGAALCWGLNGAGQVGDGTSANKLTPVPVTGLGANVAGVSAGENHTCAILTDGSLRCWGGNGSGQLGTGSTVPSLVPIPVTGL